ncbi:uncharacterized protein LOC129766477 [Toxorhynchites rutilus septentrionalis]|uniref:uncharacterized protein LOC129766477 n=1 Tax=Toxorhynchites rutilus septentrionalis TaxID=329112 RepID=UPI0024786C4E|nr:uncharacterized protein LOC129766477 [Toxorhynchites rutilus septentrionalis]
MAPLPVARSTPYVRPFSYVGIDYCGPFLIRSGRSNVKRWVALFTCLTIRAVHLEVVHSLSAESCKLAIRRFIARRGAPQEIYSDCGTNFQAVSKELIVEINDINRHLANTFTNTTTQWNFNPPAAPHMGGIWERMVRSIKVAMISLSAARKPDDESFVTVLIEAESMVNSRPLTYMPLETESQESLTPNHFLLMSSSGIIQPPKSTPDERTTLRSNWNMVQLLIDQFWKRWIREYLPSISNRSKWFKDIEPPTIGALVLTAHEELRNSWTRGRVIKVYPGKDGRVRRVDIQTKNGIFQRPVSKLVVLEVGNDCIAGSVDQQYGVGDVADISHRGDNKARQLGSNLTEDRSIHDTP